MKQSQKKEVQIKVIERQSFNNKNLTDKKHALSDPTVYITTTVTLIGGS